MKCYLLSLVNETDDFTDACGRGFQILPQIFQLQLDAQEKTVRNTARSQHVSYSDGSPKISFP